MRSSNEVPMRPVGERTALVSRVIKIIALDIIKCIIEMSRSFLVRVHETESCLAIRVFHGIIFLFGVRRCIEVSFVCAVSSEDEGLQFLSMIEANPHVHHVLLRTISVEISQARAVIRRGKSFHSQVTV